MYRTGHLGMSLLVFAPIGYALVAGGYTAVALLTGASMLWLAMLPDTDQRVPFVPHRGPTHSLLFAGVVGAVFAGAGWLLGDVSAVSTPEQSYLAAVGFGIGFVTVFAHLLGDVLTPAGVNFFWPVSGREYSLYVSRADNTIANYLLFLVGLFAASSAMLLAFGFV